MKQLSLVVIAFISFMSLSNAQEVMFGAKAGVNFANIVSDSDANTDNFGGLDDDNTLTAFHAGLTGDVKLAESFGLGAELLYSRQGAKYEGNVVNGDVKLDYLSIPILAKLYVSPEFNLYAGVQPSFLMKAESEGEIFGFEGTTDLKERDLVKTSDFAIPVGLGYRMQNGLQFDARYNIGTTAVYVDSDDNSNETGKNRVLQLGVGFNF